MQFVLNRKVEEFVVRNTAPQEEGETRSQFDVADPIVLVAPSICGIPLHAEQELRTHAQRSELRRIEERPARGLASDRLVRSAVRRLVVGRLAGEPAVACRPEVVVVLQAAGGLHAGSTPRPTKVAIASVSPMVASAL